MDQIVIAGVSFRTLDLAGREAVAAQVGEPGLFAQSLISRGAAAEAVVVSTCNRLEVVCAGDRVRSSLEIFGETLPQKSIYELRNVDAVKHLYRVASSLDSMVVGETQILGQVKDAYQVAIRAGAVGSHLHHLFQSAFHVAKRVRSNTGVAQSGISVSFVAVKLAQQIFGDLSDRTALILGSGEMAELAALHLVSQGCKRLIVVNRTLERALELAERFGGSAVGLSELESVLPQAHIVIGSVTSDKAIIDPAMIRRMKRREPLFLIDLGLPRNFSPGLAEMDSVYLYNLDDLIEISSKNMTLREESRHEADIIIEHGLLQYERWLAKVRAAPEILDFRQQVRAVLEQELSESISLEPQELSDLAYRVSQKIGHRFTEALSRCLKREDGSDEELLELLKSLR